MSAFLERIKGLSRERLALLASELQQKLEQTAAASHEPIAIIGAAGRYPGGQGRLDAFWDLLCSGHSAIEQTPSARWNIDAPYDPNPDAPGHTVTRHGAFLHDFDLFDAEFFGASEKHAVAMDPQQRALLEVTWEALEDAGRISPPAGGAPVGVFVGVCTSDYADVLCNSTTDWGGYLARGTSHSLAAGRLSYALGLQGPSMAVDTACSSSLVATHLACRSLRAGECDLAVTAGVNIIMSPIVTIDLSRARLLSPSGRCRPFDARADGYVRGEGCGALILKRLSDAVRDRDRIIAVIRGSAVNHDGRGSGLIAPNGAAQRAVIERALADGNVDPRDVGYMEASSVGTLLGDPVELDSLARTLGERHPGDPPLVVGTIKPNIGHLEGASGMAALTKTALTLGRATIVQHADFEQPNPHIRWSEMTVAIPRSTGAWRSDRARLAGVSSFSFSGSNAHIVLEQAPERPRRHVRSGPFVLPLSARTPDALATLAGSFAERLRHADDDELGDVCYTAAVGRRSHRLRAAVVVHERCAAATDVASVATHSYDLTPATSPPRIAFLFPRVAPTAELIARLREEQPEFGAALDRCDQAWQSLEDGSLNDRLRNDRADRDPVASFCFQYALASTWRAWGAEPFCVLGEDEGELVASCIAGMLSLDDGLALARSRSGLRSSVAVPAMEWGTHVNQMRNTSWIEPWTAAIARAKFGREHCRIVSGVTGRAVARGELADGEYWLRQLGGSPGYGRGLDAVASAGAGIALSMSTDPTPAHQSITLVPALHMDPSGESSTASPLAQLYRRGVEIDWESVHRAQAFSRTSLPTYPFQRARYWPDVRVPSEDAGAWSTVRWRERRSSLDGGMTSSARATIVTETQAGTVMQTLIAEVGALVGSPATALDLDAPLAAQGLDSLRALQLKDRLALLLGADVPLASLAHVRTIRDLASVLEGQTLGGPGTAGLEPITVADGGDERFESFPLTDVQQAYWLGRLGSFSLGGVATHFYFEYEPSRVDVVRFEHALHRLIDRHDMLRAVVLPSGRQTVLATVPRYRIQTHDLSSMPEADVERELDQRRRLLSHEVRDASRWPLFDVQATILPGGRTRLHVGIDMLIADAWSIQLLARDLGLAYADPDRELPSLQLTFRHCVMAAQAFEQSDAYRTSAAYWRDRLRTLPPPPELPLAKHPDEIGRPSFVRRTLSLPRDVWEIIQARSIEGRVSKGTVVLTAFAHVLRNWSKSPRFTLNLTLFNRPQLHPQINQVVGDFTSLTLLEANLEQPATFMARVRALQERLWEDLDHRHFSGVRVLRELAAASGRSLEAVMPVVFTSAIGLSTLDAHGESGINPSDLVFSVSQTPQVWLDHQVFEHDGRLEIIWDAVEDLFPPGLLDDMFAAYTRLLEHLGRPDTSWDDPVEPLLPVAQEERRKQVNQVSAPLEPALLHELFHRQVERAPDAPAVIAGQTTLTYRQLARRATAVAARLRGAGARPGGLVAVVMEKGWPQVVATLGILESGAAYLPIDPGVPPDRLRYLLEWSEVSTVLTTPAFSDSLTWPECVKLRLDEWPDPGDLNWRPLTPAAESRDLAYVIYTSGSTGLPKGVEIDHRGAVNTIVDINRRFGVTPEDRVLALSSLTFDLSVWDIFGLLAAGGAIVFPDAGSRRDPEHWRRLVQEGVTIWNTVPTLMRLLVESAEARSEGLGNSLRLVMMSGDWIPVGLPDRIRARSGRGAALDIVSLGGATEASIWSVFHPVHQVDPAWTSIPYGRPLTNQALHVLDRDLAPRPDWTPGDLYIEGAGLARGYWRDEEKSRAAFIHHPRTGKRLYRTGDLARYRPSGDLEFLGREDAEVKVNGYRVELGEIEAHLGAHPDVRHAICVAHGERDAERRLVACVVAETAQPPDAESLRTFLAVRLPDYLIPSAYVPIDHVPLGSNGKVDRAAALRLVEDALARRTATSPPAEISEDPIVQRLLTLVRSELQLDVVTADTNLLSIGANSLDMLRLINEADTQLGFRPKVEEFFRRPSIAGLADLHRRWQAGEPVAQDATAHAGSNAPDLTLTLEHREALKRSESGLRRFSSDRRRVALGMLEPTALGRAAYLTRRSYRDFEAHAVPRSALAKTLACLRRFDVGDGPRRMYASANGLYPVQAYLYVKPHRVEGLDAGTYYLAPQTGDLTVLTPGATIGDDIHVPYNQRVARGSAFTIFLVAGMEIVRPLYADLSDRLVHIEAGLIAELLDLTGPSHGIGFCQIGSVAFESVRSLFELDEQHILVHTMLGGGIAAAAASQRELIADSEERDIGSV